MYFKIRVWIRIREFICGGVPTSPSVIEAWLNAKKVPLQEALNKTIEDMGAELLELEERCETGFKYDKEVKELYIEQRQVKAMLKESANVTGVTMMYRGAKNFITNGIFVDPVKLHLGVKEPSAIHESVAHISGPTGKRSALKRFAVVESPTIKMQVRVLARADGKEIVPIDVIHKMFLHAQDSGLGANRSQGYGTFDLVEFDVIEKPDPKTWPKLTKPKNVNLESASAD